MCFVGDYVIDLFSIGVLEEAKFFHISKLFEPLEALIHVSQSFAFLLQHFKLFCIIAVCKIQNDTCTCTCFAVHTL